MVDYLYTLPLWSLAAVLTIVMVGYVLLGLFVLRRWLMPRMRLKYEDADYGGALVQSSMMMYALIAALTAVGVWQRYSVTSTIVSAEATSIALLWRDLGVYPPELRDSTRGILKGYTEQIIHGAWPQQRAGLVPREGVEWMDRLQDQIAAFEPGSEAQKIGHAEVFRSFNVLVQHRRERLDSVTARLPEVIWWVLLPGAFLCLGMCLFFHVDHVGYQAVMLSGTAIFMAMVLFLIVALDRPFAGDRGITADSYQLIYDHHMTGG